MKTIGLIGGLSWNSTAEYYRIINQEIHQRLGGLSSARLLIHSFNFQEIVDLQNKNNWEEIESQVISAGFGLQKAGAEVIIFGANTTHRFADGFQKAVNLPLIHIADVVAKEIKQLGISRIGLLGTRTTMTLDFYKNRLSSHGIATIVPDTKQIEEIHRIIFDELCMGRVEPRSKTTLLESIKELSLRGAEGSILGCTELPLILESSDHSLPLIDSTRLHALAAVDFALA